MRMLFFFIFSLFFFFTPLVHADSGWVINSFDSNITVKSDGHVQVVEKIDVDFYGVAKHGIFREIPYVYQDDQGVKTYTDVVMNSVLQDGKPAKYKVEKNSSNIQLRIGDANKTIIGKHTYDITYTLAGILRAYSTHDELYWNVTGNYWDAQILKASSHVTIPKEEITQVICYQGHEGSTEQCEAQIDSPVTAHFTVQRNLVPSEGMTIAVGFTKNIVPILNVSSPKNIVNDMVTPISITTFFATLLIGFFGIAMVWWKNGRDYWFRTPLSLDKNARLETEPVLNHETTVVEFESPDKLRPAELGVLMDERADTLDVTSTIIDLAVRGYISIKELPKSWLFGSVDYELMKEKNADDKLLPYERLLLTKLFENKDNVTVSSLKQKFYDDLAEVKKSLYTDVMKKKLFVENPESIRLKYLVLGIVIGLCGGLGIFLGVKTTFGPLVNAGIALIILSLFFMLLSRVMPRRSAYGHGLYQRGKGYYLFLSGAEKYRQQFYEKKNLFNELLPYAIMFGLTKKFADAMKKIGVKPEQYTWYSGTRPFNPVYFASSVNDFSRSVSTAIASTPSRSGGFSGGSSGSGFGGGGGGSW